ncbi:MAG: 30S ribosomal protein S3 [Gammaproteobacteria bacterium]|nr:30S ribosomal protein S3 [Gammaproteobacteria bacterium]MCH9744870.1 30S ribosomal protein S3 [Gammaproteobacteria bacterium]
MGQKVNPRGMRLGITEDWTSKWYATSKDYARMLNEDLEVRDFLMQRLKGAAIGRVQIERPAKNAKIAIHSARPGVIIGKKGNEVEELRNEIARRLKVPVHITIEEIRKPELNSKLVAESVAQQLERRVMFRRAMKRAIQSTMRQGALGIKVSVSGRLGGAEIARTEWTREGRVPLHTFRADIDYNTAIAKTTYGIIGVKVWIFKGEIHEVKESQEKSAAESEVQESTEE